MASASRAQSFTFPALPVPQPASGALAEAGACAPITDTLAVPSSPAGADSELTPHQPTAQLKGPSEGFPPHLVPPPLPARLRLSNKRQLPDDAAAALSLVLPAAAAAAAAAAGDSSRQQPEQPSRQMSLDAVAGLLKLPQVQQGGEVPGQTGRSDRQATGSPRSPQQRQRGQQEQPAAKRAKKAGGGSTPNPGAQLLPVPLPKPGWISQGPLNESSSSPRQLAGHLLHLPPLLPSPRRGQALTQPVHLPPLLPGAGAAFPVPAAAPSHSPGLPGGSGSPLRGTGSGATPPGGNFLTGLAGAEVEARQGTPGLGGPEGGGSSSSSIRADALRQQMLLALLQALPEDQQRGLPGEVVVAPLPAAPSTPPGQSSDDLPSPPWEASLHAGLPPSPGHSPPLRSQPQPQPQASQPPSPAAAPRAAAAAQAAAADGPEGDARRMWAAAAALPMPPMPPPPPSVAAAAAAARAGGELAPEQRQAMFEHSVGVLVWMMQQLQHQAFLQSTSSTLQAQQLRLLAAWAQRVRGCLRQMQGQWRELVVMMQAAVVESAGQLGQQQLALDALALVQQEVVQQLCQMQHQQQQRAQQQQQEGQHEQPPEQQQVGQERQASLAAQPQAQQCNGLHSAGPKAEGAGTPDLCEAQQPPQYTSSSAEQVCHLAEENAELRRQVAQLWAKQKEHHAAARQLGSALAHERQQRQQLHSTVDALQAQLHLVLTGLAGAAGAPGRADVSATASPRSPQQGGVAFK